MGIGFSRATMRNFEGSPGSRRLCWSPAGSGTHFVLRGNHRWRPLRQIRRTECAAVDT